MKPGEEITSHYPLPQITEEAVREAEAQSIIDSLDALFEGDSDAFAITRTLDHAMQATFALINTGTLVNREQRRTASISRPYEMFEDNGVNCASRIIRAQTAPPNETYSEKNGYVQASIYFLSLLGEDQREVSENNLSFGLLKAGIEQVFFKVRLNKTTGMFAVEHLSPDERSMVVNELAKAVHGTDGSTSSS